MSIKLFVTILVVKDYAVKNKAVSFISQILFKTYGHDQLF